MNLAASSPTARQDLLTIGAISVAAYVIANVFHEGVGHAGACIVTGCTPRVLTTAYFEGEMSQVGDIARRFIAAAGTLVNLAAGILFLAFARQSSRTRPHVEYFLWFSGAVNVLIAAGYPLFSGVLGVGDWITVTHGWGTPAAVRFVLAVAGVVFYGSAVLACLPGLARLAATSTPGFAVRAARLTWIPYVVGSTASTIGAFFNPRGMALVLTSAAAHFGGTSALAWMSNLLDTRAAARFDGEPLILPRSWPWIAAAAVALVLHVAVLGQGLRL